MTWRSLTTLATVLFIGSLGAALAEEHIVLATPDNTFEPENLTIAVGDTVTWMNAGGLHNVNSPGNFRCANGCDGMGGDGSPATNPWSFSLTFDDPEVIDYFCDVHLGIGMVGTVTVVEASDMVLDIVGTCPGSIDLTLTGATPGGRVAFARSTSEGSAIVPAGGCAGTPLDLDSPSLLTILTANGAGEIGLSRNVTNNQCGLWLQAVDTTTCSTSNTAQLP